MQKLFGTVVPIVTPLTDEDAVDEGSLRNLVDHVIEGGLQCLYPCGTTGEMMYLTVKERKEVAEITVNRLRGGGEAVSQRAGHQVQLSGFHEAAAVHDGP